MSRVFSSESALCIRWSNYWSFSFSISPSSEYSGLISFRVDWLDLTPIEYYFLDGAFYFLSEGGLKFKALKDNKNVSIAIFDVYDGFGNLKGLQVQGKAWMIEPFSDEYLKIFEYKKIPVEAIRKMHDAMNLIKVVPKSFDYLDSELKQENVDIRQHLEL